MTTYINVKKKVKKNEKNQNKLDNRNDDVVENDGRQGCQNRKQKNW